MLAIGVGGADAVDALTGTPWELKAPKIVGEHHPVYRTSSWNEHPVRYPSDWTNEWLDYAEGPHPPCRRQVDRKGM